MVKPIYDPYLFFKSKPFGIISLQNNNFLILAEDFFITIKEITIRIVNIMTKKHIYLTFKMFIKFNNIFI